MPSTVAMAPLTASLPPGAADFSSPVSRVSTPRPRRRSWSPRPTVRSSATANGDARAGLLSGRVRIRPVGGAGHHHVVRQARRVGAGDVDQPFVDGIAAGQVDATAVEHQPRAAADHDAPVHPAEQAEALGDERQVGARRAGHRRRRARGQRRHQAGAEAARCLRCAACRRRRAAGSARCARCRRPARPSARRR